MFKKIKIVLIFICIAYIFTIYEYMDSKNHEYIINNVFYNGKEYNRIEYIGYIEIERLNIKREIVRDINEKNLLSHVALNDNCINLNCDNIILAGHAIKNIFGNLKYIKKGDIINIVSYNDRYVYETTEVKIVNKDKKDAIDNSELILITCKDLFNRIIVKAKKINQ